MEKVLIIVDMQNDFVDGSLGTKEAQELVPALVTKLQTEIEKGTKLIFTKDTHDNNYLETQEGKKLPVEHCIRGTRGWEIIARLQKYVKNVIEKPTFGAIQLPALVKDAEMIEVVGLCTDICVISNVLLLKAHYPEKKIQVDAACCAGISPESHQNALEVMRMCQIDIVNA